MSFDRPEYLGKLLGSLEEQTDLEDVDFHLFQDGAVNEFSGRVAGDGELISECVQLFGFSVLPVKSVHGHSGNIGIARNGAKVLGTLTGGYEWVIALEDDVVLSPHYLRLARVLFAQMRQREDVAAFSLGFKKLCARHRVAENLDKVIWNFGHWWGDGLWSRKWREWRPYYDEYVALVSECDYRDRPHGAIVDLFKRRGWPSPGTTQDAARDMAIAAAGMQRVRAVVNRGISVGRRGQHFTPRQFSALGFDDQEPYVFESDGDLERFAWRR